MEGNLIIDGVNLANDVAEEVSKLMMARGPSPGCTHTTATSTDARGARRGRDEPRIGQPFPRLPSRSPTAETYGGNHRLQHPINRDGDHQG